MRVLLLNSSHNDLGLIRSLKKLGCEIYVTGNIPNLVGQKYCDKYIQCDYSDKDKILKICIDNHIERICACCNDFGVYTASYVAEKLNFPGYDKYDNVLKINHKDEFRKICNQLDINSPKFNIFNNTNDAIDFCNSNNISFPCIIKPIDLSAGNGIKVINNNNEAKYAIVNAFKLSREKRILIEEYIKGDQFGFCTFIINKKVVIYCSNNEYSIINPYRVEIDTFPSKYEYEYKDILIRYIEKIVNYLNLNDGIFHVQCKVNNNKIYVIEAMRRVLGNMYSVPANMRSSVDWDYLEAKKSIGMIIDDKDYGDFKLDGFYAYRAIMSRKNGIINDIIIDERLSRYKYDEFYLLKKGDFIDNYLKQPIGFIFLKFNSEFEMENNLIDNYNYVNVITN